MNHLNRLIFNNTFTNTNIILLTRFPARPLAIEGD